MNEELKAKLKELGLNEEQITKLENEGAKTTEDVASLSANEIKAATECGLVTAKKVVKAFAPVPVPESAAAQPQPVSMDILPSVPDDSTFLEMLKVGGVLKITPTDVISAMRATIAGGMKLYELPDILADKMEQFANDQGEPVGETFYRINAMITHRSYGDLFAALPGVTGNFVSERRKREVLTRLNTSLWPSLQGFNKQLIDWSDSWTRGMANPTLGLAFLAMSQSGMPSIMPPGMMQPPETAGLRDAAEGVIDQINKIFAGTGIPVARALAWEATRIKGILEEPGLLAAVGATSREQMLKMLGVDVSADYVRLERNVTRYALAVMELKNVVAGAGEYGYLAAMLTLGMAIPWDKLGKWETKPVKREVQPSVGSGFPRA
jgi:hypothetical protein